MRDTQLYQQILGLSEPWQVERVELQMEAQEVHVFVKHDAGVSWPCPTCGKALACFDHAPERVWRHLDTCQLKTLLHARVPRVDCPEHGVLQAKVPWAEPRGRFTLLMERMIIDVIQACSTIAGACVVMRTSWEEAWGVMQRAVDKVRRREHRELMADADETLKGSKHLWLYARRNLPDKHKPTLARLMGLNLKVGRAWALKETLAHLWRYSSEGWARRFFKGWYGRARRSALEPVKKVALMIKSRLDQIVSYHRHHVTNGVAEGLNSKIMTIKRKACGFRNPQNFKTAIFFHCGGLELYPR